MELYSELLGAITHCISDSDPVVCERAGEANKDLLELVQVRYFGTLWRRCLRRRTCPYCNPWAAKQFRSGLEEKAQTKVRVTKSFVG